MAKCLSAGEISNSLISGHHATVKGSKHVGYTNNVKSYPIYPNLHNMVSLWFHHSLVEFLKIVLFVGVMKCLIAAGQLRL